MSNTQNELERMCKGIADELKEIYNGDKAAELENKIDELAEQKDAQEDELADLEDELADAEDSDTSSDRAYRIAEIERAIEKTKERVIELGAVIDELEEEKESLSMWNYFNDVLDIEYTIGSDGDYRGVCLMVAWGGPNIYVDTRRGEVWGAWWGDKAAAWIPSEVCEAIDEVFEEYYTCTR